MIGDFNRTRLAVGRLRAFASLTSGAHPDADAIVRDLLEHADGAAREPALAVYRELYGRLRELPPRAAKPGASDSPRGTDIRADFQQLRDVQRGAVFLVLGLDFSIEEAAAVLDEPESWLAMEVISAMFSLEHIMPGERAYQRRRRVAPARQAPREAAASGGAGSQPPWSDSRLAAAIL